MYMPNATLFKLLIVAGLLASAGLAFILSGFGLPAILLSAAGLTTLWLWFIRKPRTDGELPCSSVSCCHYLGDCTEERTGRETRQ